MKGQEISRRRLVCGRLSAVILLKAQNFKRTQDRTKPHRKQTCAESPLSLLGFPPHADVDTSTMFRVETIVEFPYNPFFKSEILHLRSEIFLCPHRLVRSRTPDFHFGNRGSNPLGDAFLPSSTNPANGLFLRHIFALHFGCTLDVAADTACILCTFQISVSSFLIEKRITKGIVLKD